MKRPPTDYQGAQIPLICFDELTHFTEASVLVLAQPQPVDLRRAALRSRDLQPGRR